ncbi:hypothetical protein ABK040_010198 [Willaertia magna]
MLPSLQHFIGKSLKQLPTPCLIIDEKAYQKNLLLMKQQSTTKVNIRPHFKAHKCPSIAKDQLEKGGAIGVCCQKLSEAIEAVKTVDDVFISNQIVSIDKLKIIKQLNTIPNKQISLCVDNEQVISLIDQIMSEDNESNTLQNTLQNNLQNNLQLEKDYKKKLSLVVEYNVGQNRCGTNSHEETLHLINFIKNNCKNVVFKGLHCYNGANQHIVNYNERKEAVRKVIEKTQHLIEYLSKNNILINYVTGGGTGTWEFEAASGIFTEIQPGSYLFGDVDYGRVFTKNGKKMFSLLKEEEENFNKNLKESDANFVQSLFILTTVISKTIENDRFVVDVGLKGVSLDSGVPLLENLEMREMLTDYKAGGDEHGIFEALLGNEGSKEWIKSNIKIGDVLKLIPGHVDPTFNMYDNVAFYDSESQLVTRVEEISARGPGI